LKQIRKRLTYANVMSSIAVFLVLGGATAFAAHQLGKNSVGTKQLKKNAVVAAKIKNNAVTSAKITDGAVSNGKLANSAVTVDKLADGSVATGKIADLAVTTGKIANNGVATGKLAESSVTTGKIANGAVTPAKLSQQYLPLDTVGVPVAGANIASNGEVRKFFNRAGGAPTVSHTATSGTYIITFPGLEGQAFFNNSIAIAALAGGASGEISRASSGGNPFIGTFNSAGTATDKEFEFVLFVPGS
jgi:hypothetical protein